MTTNLFNLTAIAFYIITWVLIAKSVRANITTPEQTSKPSKLYFVTWAIALIAHIIACIAPLTNTNELSFNFTSLDSYVMCFISLILFISTLSRKIQALAIVILPLTILSVVVFALSDAPANDSLQINSGLGIHVLVSLLAYSTLMLAAVQAILLATQNNFLHKGLKNPSQSGFFKTLPALEDMEYFLFHLISVGVLLLSISLLSGFYYLENLFGSSVAHKTILSLFSWIIFSALLIGRYKYGWRGKTAVRWTLVGFAVLALAFFGSKFIQEFIIKKETTAYNQTLQNNPIVKSRLSINNQLEYKKTSPHLSYVFFIQTNKESNT